MTASISEKGHAKNIANLKLLITNIQAIGNTYKPTHSKLAISELQNLYDEAFNAQKNVNLAIGPYKMAVAERENFFKPLGKLITKLRKAYKSTEAIQLNNMENFMAVARKIRGAKKNSTKSDTPDLEAQQNSHSASQLSYDQKTNNFEQLIAILANTNNYDPNESEYQITTLKALHQEMLNKTNDIAQSYIPLNNYRSVRNDIMYLATDSLVDIANKTKDYLFTILNVQSAQYKTISKIKFNKI